jgi:hypothetical protein
MKFIRNLGSILFGSFFTMSSFAANFSTPENAIKTLEDAYTKKDLEAAVAARDFFNEAKIMLKNINPKYANDLEMLKQTTEVLELSFRKEMKEEGFPDFSNLECSLGKAQNVSPSLVKLKETCIFPDGGTSIEDVHVFKSEKGWRVINVPRKP